MYCLVYVNLIPQAQVPSTMKSYIHVQGADSEVDGVLVFEDADQCSIWSTVCSSGKVKGATLGVTDAGLVFSKEGLWTGSTHAPPTEPSEHPDEPYYVSTTETGFIISTPPQSQAQSQSQTQTQTQTQTRSTPKSAVARVTGNQPLVHRLINYNNNVQVLASGLVDQPAMAKYELYNDVPDNEEFVQKTQEPGPAFQATSDIKAYATTLFKNKDYRAALAKYQKAFRYCTELVPDETQHPVEFAQFEQVKVALNLNIALAALQCTPPNTTLVINHASGVIDAPASVAKPTDKAKAYFRRGQAHAAGKQVSEALADYQAALALVPGDALIAKHVAQTQTALDASRAAQKSAYSKFFA